MSEIPKNLEYLVGPIAEEIHNDWVRWRMAEGFTYSEQQDYEKKTHPHVRFWNELPEEHRESDYRAAKAALVVLIKKNILKENE